MLEVLLRVPVGPHPSELKTAASSRKRTDPDILTSPPVPNYLPQALSLTADLLGVRASTQGLGQGGIQSSGVYVCEEAV